MPKPLRRLARLHPLQRVAIVAWVLLLAGVSVRLLIAPVRSHTVVPIYLTAAERWLESAPLYLEAPPLDVYRNPPGLAAAFVPFTWLPERLAGIVWRWLGVALFLTALARWMREGLPRPLSPGESGLVFTLVSILAVPSVNNGQMNMLMVGALLYGATAAAQVPCWWKPGAPSTTPARQRVYAAAGIWLAAAAAVKVYPAAVGLLVGLVDRRRVFPWFFGAALVFFVLPFALRDPDYVATECENFLIHVLADDRTWAGLTRAPQDLFLALRVWAAPPPVEIYLVAKLLVAIGMAGLVGLVLRQTHNSRLVSSIGFHLGCVWITVLGPATEVQTYVLLAPSAAVSVVQAAAERQRRAGLVRLGLAIVGYGLLILPIIRDMFPHGKAFHALALPPIGGTLILVAVIWSAAQAIRTTRTAASAELVKLSPPETLTLERKAPCPTDRAA
jgi:hypothetical protein